jgi:hypothetical protein
MYTFWIIRIFLLNLHPPPTITRLIDITLCSDKPDIVQILLHNKPLENIYKVQLCNISKIKFQKFTLKQATKAQRGKTDIALLFL